MQVAGDGGVYKISWEGDSLEFTFERFRETRGVLYAEVWVRDFALPRPHITLDTLNLGSKRAKSTFAKELIDLYPGRDWKTIIEAAATRTLLAFRQGEPVINIKDVKVDESLRYRINPFVFEKYPTLLYGDGGIGKSMFAAYLATLVREGWITDDIDIEPGPCMYLDWESSDEELAERCDMIANGLELQRPEIHYRYCSRPIADDFDYIKREIVERDVQFLVIDSAGPAAGNPLDVNDVIQFFTALRALKVSTLIIGHQPASGQNPYGNRYWWNYARSVWHMKSDDDAGSPTKDVGLYHLKANRGQRELARAYRVHFSENPHPRVMYTPSEIMDSEKLAEELPLKMRVLQHLVTNGATHYKTLAQSHSVTESAMKMCLSRNKGRFQSLGNGVYGAASTFDDAGNEVLPF